MDRPKPSSIINFKHCFIGIGHKQIRQTVEVVKTFYVLIVHIALTHRFAIIATKIYNSRAKLVLQAICQYAPTERFQSILNFELLSFIYDEFFFPVEYTCRRQLSHTRILCISKYIRFSAEYNRLNFPLPYMHILSYKIVLRECNYVFCRLTFSSRLFRSGS